MVKKKKSAQILAKETANTTQEKLQEKNICTNPSQKKNLTLPYKNYDKKKSHKFDPKNHIPLTCKHYAKKKKHKFEPKKK